MKSLGVGLVWIGVSGAVAAIAFGTHDGAAALLAGMFMAFFAMVASAAIAKS